LTLFAPFVLICLDVHPGPPVERDHHRPTTPADQPRGTHVTRSATSTSGPSRTTPSTSPVTAGPGARAAAPSAPPVLWSLNALRAGGAVLVMLFHISSWNLHVLRGSSALYTGVGLFFVLSGFVLTWTARPGTGLGAFYSRRVARILPNHLVTYALGLVLTLLVVGRPVELGTVIAGVFLLQAWLPEPEMVFAINGVTWSLSCEIAFYLAFPALLLGLRRLRGGTRVALVGTALTVPPVLAAVWPATSAVLFHLPLARLPEFCVGMVTAMAVQQGWRPRVPAPVLLACLGATVLLAAALDERLPATALTALLAALFAPLAARCARGDIEERNAWVQHPVVRLAGALSFSFYLLHELVIKALVATPLRGWWVVPFVLVASAALSYLLWRSVELPGRARILRLSRPGATSSAPAPAAAGSGRPRHSRPRSTAWSFPVRPQLRSALAPRTVAPGPASAGRVPHGVGEHEAAAIAGETALVARAAATPLLARATPAPPGRIPVPGGRTARD
jgi:peptidoglycan/LPS O-acetylase OafA/YrhL